MQLPLSDQAKPWLPPTNDAGSQAAVSGAAGCQLCDVTSQQQDSMAQKHLPARIGRPPKCTGQSPCSPSPRGPCRRTQRGCAGSRGWVPSRKCWRSPVPTPLRLPSPAQLTVRRRRENKSRIFKRSAAADASKSWELQELRALRPGPPSDRCNCTKNAMLQQHICRRTDLPSTHRQQPNR